MGNSSSKKKDKNQSKDPKAKDDGKGKKEEPKGKKEEPKGDKKTKEEQPVLTRLRMPLMTEEVELHEQQFRDNTARGAMLEKPFLKKLVNGQVWHMKPELLRELEEDDLLREIWKCYARALVLETDRSEMAMVMVSVGSEEEREWPFPVPIYRNLLAIGFATLRKIKIKGSPRDSASSIVSLHLLQYVQAPHMEELLADGHSLTSLNFLRKCYWPRLSHLSLRDTFVADCQNIATILPSVSNSSHLQEINIACPLSGQWVEVGWICKMGFEDAKREIVRLENDDKYWKAYGNRILRRVDMGLGEIKNRGKHVDMVKKKFNNSFFDNPIALW